MGLAKVKAVLALCLAVFSVFLLEYSLSSPWFDVQYDRLTCSFGWSFASCRDDSENVALRKIQEHDWRMSSSISIKIIFDIAHATTMAAMIIMFLMTIVLHGSVFLPPLRKLLDLSPRDEAKFYLLTGIMGTLLLAGGVVYFALELSVSEDFHKPVGFWGQTRTHANNPFQESTSSSSSSELVTMRWGPSGWSFALAACPLYMLTVYLAYSSSCEREKELQQEEEDEMEEVSISKERTEKDQDPRAKRKIKPMINDLVMV
eukprot:TRINITY_DN1985_c0_g1_i1.p1 TRINITY_DN1985_c0_g1~~TRINITY_DN1985_c0_g1_i1.p1  ORF type:complete len:260 (-),score=50.52 TRINITY_DN1985_c0_g1_i1:104-883(-)